MIGADRQKSVAPYGYSLWNQTHDLKCLLDALAFDQGIL